MAVLGIPGSGKTVTLLRRVWIAARAGMRVVFLDFKGTDPALAWQVTCAYRLANPAAVVGFWRRNPWTCGGRQHGDRQPAARRRRLGQRGWRRLLPPHGHPGRPAGLHPPSGPPRSSGDFLHRLDMRKLQQLWRGDDTARVDLEQLAADLVHAGRAVRLSILQALTPAQVQEEASALRAAAMTAAEPAKPPSRPQRQRC
jgi:hypothetical protein